jgi:hypothetical protein
MNEYWVVFLSFCLILVFFYLVSFIFRSRFLLVQKKKIDVKKKQSNQ